MVNFRAICGCCTRTDIVREHLEDTVRICDVSAWVYSATIERLSEIIGGGLLPSGRVAPGGGLLLNVSLYTKYLFS